MKFITVQQAEAQKDSSLFLVNLSGSNHIPAGVINLTVVESHGRSVNVVLPITTLPLDATTQATKTTILSDPNFRRLVQRKMIGIVSSEEGEEIINDPKNEEELSEMLSAISRVSTMSGMGEATPEAKAATATAEEKVSPVALSIGTATTDEARVLRQLKQQLGALTNEDLEFIVNTSVLAGVKAAAAEAVVK